MTAQFIKRVVFARGQLIHAVSTETHRSRYLRRHMEAHHFYKVLASRPQYYVGKLDSVEVKNPSEAVRSFLSQSFTPWPGTNVIHQVAYEARDFPRTTVEALLLKIHSALEKFGAYGGRRGAREDFRPLLSALTERAEELIKAEESLELEFTLADLFYRAYASSWGILKTILPRQASAVRHLKETDFLQHLFFSILVRGFEPDTQEAVPAFIENACDPLDLEEVALVCFACFTAQYQLPNSDQWLKIVDKLEKHKGPIPDITMGILAKYLRYIQPKRTYEYAATARFMEAAGRRQADWSLSTHLRLANAGTQARVCNEEVIRGVVPKLLKQLPHGSRIKDIYTGLYAHAYFGIILDTKDAEAFMEELKKHFVERRYHHFFVKSVCSLASMEYYNEELLIKALDRDAVLRPICHEQAWFDTLALYFVCKLMFPHLLGNKILLTDRDMRPSTQNVLLHENTSRRYPLYLQVVTNFLEKEFHLTPRLVQTLNIFSQKDIHIGDKLVLVVHTERFYSNYGLIGFRRWRVSLTKKMGYDVVEIPVKFFSWGVPQQVRFLREELSVRRSL